MTARVAVVLLIALAIHGPEQASAAQPDPVLRAKVLFYTDVREKRFAAAVVPGAVYRKRYPHDDRFALDYAYAQRSAGQTAAARSLLQTLARSPYPEIRAESQEQAAALKQPPEPPPPPPPFTEAYALLAMGNLDAAREAFVSALATHPDDAAAWHQLAYINWVLKDHADMIVELDHYIALRPDDDRAKLERVYALAANGKRAQASAALRTLTRSTDAVVAAIATNELAADSIAAGPPRLDAFGYGENESRFHDTFYGLDARYVLAPTPIEPYLDFDVSNVAKASSLPAPTILNDQVAILALGLRARLAPNTYAFVQAGEAQSLLTGHSESDLRYGVLLATRLGAGGARPQTEIDASVAHFSRYLDTIAYGTVAYDFFIGSKVVRGVVGTNAVLDTSRDFYNNAIEGFGGIQVREGLFTLRLAALAGEYLARGINPPQRTYTSINPVVLFGLSR